MSQGASRSQFTPRSWRARLASIPWEKTLIWTLFLLIVWVLRDLFLIIFLTFLLSYILRSGVTFALRKLFRGRDSVLLERGLTLIAFVVFLGTLYGVGSFLGPRLVAQGEALVERVTRLQPQQEFDDVLAKTVGAYLFGQEYGSPGEERYERAFRQYREEGLEIQAYKDFPALEAAIEGPFIARLVALERRRVQEEIGLGGAVDRELRRWFLEAKAPQIFAANRRRLVDDWEARYRETLRNDPAALPLHELKREPGFAARRDQQILDGLFDALYDNPEERARLVAEWSEATTARLAAALHERPIDQQPGFAAYYADRRRLDPAAVPYPYAAYLGLKHAYGQDEKAFAAALAAVAPVRSESVARLEFQISHQRMMARRWMAGPLAIRLREVLGRYLESVAAAAGTWLREQLGAILTLPFKLGLALVLSFFITWDIPRLRRGLRRLEASRLHHAYHEIVPSLVSFGHLIGRSFQAQAVIAIINSILTFFAIHLLGIQSALVLCSIVFVFSFIPIVGVVASSIPIAVMAIVQPGGSLVLALQAILAIVVIHLIETSLLNPKIVGDMLHLHPVLVLAVLAIGEHFFGVWGLLLAVPVTVYVIRYVVLAETLPPVVLETGAFRWPPEGDAGKGAPAERQAP